MRDYIHVSDLSRAHVDALEYLRRGGASKVFNCGNGRGYSVLEVVHALGRVTGKDLKAENAARRPGDPAIVIADASRIRKEFGWTPEYTELETILQHELAWVRSRVQNSMI